jgi:endo-1,4-beta-xylanase
MYNGSAYSISVWVKLAPTATQNDTIRVSLQTTLAGTTSYHTVINNTPVPLGAWVLLSIPTYSMALAYDPGQASLYVESNSGTQSFYIDDFHLTYLPPVQIQTDIPSIYQTLAQYFPVGAAIDPTSLSGPHAELLAKHFNSIVSGNDMKWSSTEPKEGQFDFSTADREVSFAQTHDMRIRGHNLVWSSGAQVPSWVFLETDGATPLSAANAADVSLLTQRIQNHIMTEVQHFGTAVYVWDVVNEPLDPSQPDCLNHGPFYQVLGERYLDIALRAARQYAPSGTQLFINDYSTTDANRFTCLVKVIARLRERGVPLDGIGHEMHNHIDNPSPRAIAETIETLARIFPHLHQQITELDVSVYLAGDNTSNYGANGGTVPPSLLAKQGWLLAEYFRVLRKLHCKLDALTFWGLADDDTWLDSFPITRLDMPLPFDTRLQAKPAYWGIIDPTQLPGAGLALALTSQTGPRHARVLTFTASNPSSQIAYNTQITDIQLRQLEGPPCRPVVTPSAFPVSLGDIPASGTATTSVTINFGTCSPHARFALWAPWSSATYETGRLVVGRLEP